MIPKIYSAECFDFAFWWTNCYYILLNRIVLLDDSDSCSL